MMVPASACVCALNALQNSMMFTPCWPSAGPTGGAGFAAAAGIWSLIIVRTFRAIRVPFADCRLPTADSYLFHLVVPHLNGRLAAEDRDQHLQLRSVLVDLGDLAGEVGQGA